MGMQSMNQSYYEQRRIEERLRQEERDRAEQRHLEEWRCAEQRYLEERQREEQRTQERRRNERLFLGPLIAPGGLGGNPANCGQPSSIRQRCTSCGRVWYGRGGHCFTCGPGAHAEMYFV